MRIYETTERLTDLPADVTRLEIGSILGGIHVAWISFDSKTKTYQLAIGGGSESEPIFDIEAQFQSAEKAVEYAARIFAREDAAEIGE